MYSHKDDNQPQEDEEDIKFNPPAYVQRYEAVEKALLDKRYRGQLKKVSLLLSIFFMLLYTN